MDLYLVKLMPADAGRVQYLTCNNAGNRFYFTPSIDKARRFSDRNDALDFAHAYDDASIVLAPK